MLISWHIVSFMPSFDFHFTTAVIYGLTALVAWLPAVSPAGQHGGALSTGRLVAVLLRRQFFSEARRAVLAEPRQPGPGKGESIRPDSQ